jgi:predicted transcriptional regulator
MTNTTIRMSEDLKARLSAAAARIGLTVHRFILEACRRFHSLIARDIVEQTAYVTSAGACWSRQKEAGYAR